MANTYRGNTVRLYVPGPHPGSVVSNNCGCRGSQLVTAARPAQLHAWESSAPTRPPHHHGPSPTPPPRPPHHHHGPPPRPPFHPHHGHGPFFPGVVPFAPIPLPYPVPVPYPTPAPVPAPVPAPQNFVTVVINGGNAFPNITNGYTVRYRSGLSVAEALMETGVVRFTPSGQIAAVSGMPVSGNVDYQLMLNGRIIPSTLLSFPVQPSDTVTLELIII